MVVVAPNRRLHLTATRGEAAGPIIASVTRAVRSTPPSAPASCSALTAAAVKSGNVALSGASTYSFPSGK